MSTETTNKKIKIDNGTTFGRTYTDKAIDAKLPTDLIASANKLSLGVGNTALGNGVNLDGFTYDESTKTLKAEGSGATLPAGTAKDPFKLNDISVYGQYSNIFMKYGSAIVFENKADNYPLFVIQNVGADHRTAKLIVFPREINASVTYQITYQPKYTSDTLFIPSFPETSQCAILYAKGNYSNFVEVPTDKTESYYLEGTYDATSGTSAIKWSALKKTYNHYIVISDGTSSNAIYLLIPSTSSLICSSLPELNTLLGTTNRFIQASGVVTDTASKLPIVAINWQGSIETSKILTTSSEEATTKFTDITDIVEPA